jgi:hypothetical protein
MNPLFTRVDIFNVIEQQKQRLKDAFPTVTNTELDADPIAVASRLIEEFSINVPLLDEEKKYALTKETQVDVSGDPRRIFADRSRPFYVGGTEVRIVVPFDGDPGVFDVQPTSFSLNPPFGEINDHELHLVYTLTDAGFDVEGAANRSIGEIKQYLQNLQYSAEQLKRDLQQLVDSLIEKRKKERGTHSQIVAGLKIPVKQTPTSPTSKASDSSTGRRQTSDKPQEEWDVFISHATEDKAAIAQPLAEALRARGLRVWYDDFSLRLGDGLRNQLTVGWPGRDSV